MNSKQLFEQIFYCLSNKPSILFNTNDITEWPSSFAQALKSAEILKPSSPSSSIICHGCEENCFMPVEIFPEINNRPVRAVISCDKRDDIGRIPVNIEQLKQWKISIESLALALAKLLETPTLTVTLTDDKKWNLGILKGKRITKKSPVFLFYDNEMLLEIAGHKIPLIEVLEISNNSLFIDKNSLMDYIHNPLGNTETSENRIKRLTIRVNEEKAKRTKGFLKKVAQEENISVSRLKQLITPSQKTSPQKINSRTILPSPSFKPQKSQY